MAVVTTVFVCTLLGTGNALADGGNPPPSSTDSVAASSAAAGSDAPAGTGVPAPVADITAAVAGAVQTAASNTVVVVRVDSPGNDGPITQSNTAAAAATTGDITPIAGDIAATDPASGVILAQGDQTSSPTQGSTAAAPSADQQGATNLVVSIRVQSPGDTGLVTQTNTATSSVDASDGSTVQPPDASGTSMVTSPATSAQSPGQYQDGTGGQYQAPPDTSTSTVGTPTIWIWIWNWNCSPVSLSDQQTLLLSGTQTANWIWSWNQNCDDNNSAVSPQAPTITSDNSGVNGEYHNDTGQYPSATPETSAEQQLTGPATAAAEPVLAPLVQAIPDALSGTASPAASAPEAAASDPTPSPITSALATPALPAIALPAMPVTAAPVSMPCLSTVTPSMLPCAPAHRYDVIPLAQLVASPASDPFDPGNPQATPVPTSLPLGVVPTVSAGLPQLGPSLDDPGATVQVAPPASPLPLAATSGLGIHSEATTGSQGESARAKPAAHMVSADPGWAALWSSESLSSIRVASPNAASTSQGSHSQAGAEPLVKHRAKAPIVPAPLFPDPTQPLVMSSSPGAGSPSGAAVVAALVASLMIAACSVFTRRRRRSSSRRPRPVPDRRDRPG